VASFIKIHPLSKQISRQRRTRSDDRKQNSSAAYCWRRGGCIQNNEHRRKCNIGCTLL